jgi:hypothetical protein
MFDRPPVDAPDIHAGAVPETGVDIGAVQEIERHSAFCCRSSRREARAGFKRHRLEPGGWQMDDAVESQFRIMIRGSKHRFIAPREAPTRA